MTADQIRWALRKKYCAPEHAICFECSNGTGSYGSRYLDAVAMGLYPSRGLPLYGIEIKVDRQDIRREIASPDKAERIAQYCDYFLVAYPETLKVLDLEFPPGWGLLSCDEGLVIKVVKHPEKIASVPLTKPFVAALFRAIGAEDKYRQSQMIQEEIKALEVDFDHRVQIGSDLKKLEQNDKVRFADNLVKDLAEAGFQWNQLRWSEPTFVRAVKAALTYKSLSIDRVGHVVEILRESATAIDNEMKDLIVPKPEETK